MDARQPAAPTVTVEAPCIRCGYSLRGLACNSHCPECAMPVERSLQGDLLIYSDPRYVRKLQSGTTMVITGILLIVGGVLGSMLLGFAVGMTGGGRSLMFIMIAAGLFMLGSFILYLVGWWTLATPDRDQLSDNKGERPRTFVRYAVLGTVAMKLLSIAVNSAGGVPSGLRLLINLVDNTLMAGGVIAGLIYVRWLAQRLPNAKIDKRAGTLTYLIGTFLALSILFAVGPYLGVSRTLGPTFATLTPFGTLGLFVVGLVCVVMYYNLFSWLRKNLAEISKAQQVTTPAPPA